MKVSTDESKGQAYKPKRYRGKKMRTNTKVTELKTNIDFKGRWSDLEGYIFNIGPRSSDKFSGTMKELERYLGANYSDSCQPAIITNTLETFPDPDMPTIVPDMGVECLNNDVEITYLENKNIDEAIHQKLRKKYVYETDMHMIYNIIVGHTRNQLQEKVASDANFHVVNTG